RTGLGGLTRLRLRLRGRLVLVRGGEIAGARGDGDPTDRGGCHDGGRLRGEDLAQGRLDHRATPLLSWGDSMSGPERHHGSLLAGQLAVTAGRHGRSEQVGERLLTGGGGGRVTAEQALSGGSVEAVAVVAHLVSLSVEGLRCVTAGGCAEAP